jgi:CDP-diacylglycerol--serine O-phosphatidyltransferase
VGESSYVGMALDNNVIILVFVFLFSGLVGQAGFAVALYILLVVLAGLNVAPIKTRKLAGRWYCALMAYTLAISVIYGWQLLVAG